MSFANSLTRNTVFFEKFCIRQSIKIDCLDHNPDPADLVLQSNARQALTGFDVRVGPYICKLCHRSQPTSALHSDVGTITSDGRTVLRRYELGAVIAAHGPRPDRR